MTYAEYARIPAVNWSRLKSLRVSPLQYQHDLTAPREETGFLRIGTTMHAYILEPETFRDRFCVYEGAVRRGKEWEAFKAANANATILIASEMEAAVGCAKAVLAHPVAAPFLRGGFKEAVLQWEDAETGTKCKARLDIAGARLVDLKSAGQIGKRRFASQAASLGYHGQFAYYEDGLRANGIEPTGDPVMIVVQSEPPHDVITYRMPPHVIDAGRAEYRALLELLAECEESGVWPGVAPDELVDFELPAWAEMDDEPLNLTMGGKLLAGLL